ncbi:metal-dependent hydrolase [Halorussus sp. AFM4]|uniref:metal-dependent hydrolase n=1 Tax=Halorussus sp. AFM4 TaxID=3421651 RepID=UPI003EB7DA3A
MNKEGHVLNAVLLSIGLGYVLHPAGDVPTFRAIAEISVPVVLGALFPDVDTAFGKHRKTLHNLPVLALFYLYPVYFDNLHFVWVGVATHYALDLLGSKRGIALFYPYEKEYSLPFGVPVSSKWATPVTVAVSALEVALIAGVVYLDLPVQDLTRTVAGLV